jgi:tRNA pseudouridine synthase 10
MDHNQIICNMETTTAVKSFEEKVQNVKDNYADIISLYLTDVQDSEERAKVIIELKRLSCCVRCICRFIHLREYKFYREKTEFLEATVRAVLNKQPDQSLRDEYLQLSSHETDPICPLCLGILQQVGSESWQDELLNKINNCGYEDSDYQLAVNVPSATIVRHFSMYYHLKQKLGALKYWTCSIYSMKSDEGAPEIKEVMKWVLGWIILQRLQRRFKFMCTFDVRLNFKHTETEAEYVKVVEMIEGHSRKKRKLDEDFASRAVETLEDIDAESFLQRTGVAIPPPALKAAAENLLVFFKSSVYIAGRYIKFSREMSQTPWVLDDGERRTETALTEYIENVIKPYFKADEYRFATSGREDVDVRMLGRGRPFSVEIINARKHTFTREEYTEMRDKINASTNLMKVHDLQAIEKKDCNIIQQGEETKKKHYRCVVWTSRGVTEEEAAKLNRSEEFVIDQRTPIRVLHRRSSAVRKKTIHSMQCKYVSPHYLVLDLVTQAGTYVKELVHGDMGRTVPCIASMLDCEADLLRLDCQEIELDFPPRLDEINAEMFNPVPIMDGIDVNK